MDHSDKTHWQDFDFRTRDSGAQDFDWGAQGWLRNQGPDGVLFLCQKVNRFSDVKVQFLPPKGQGNVLLHRAVVPADTAEPVL